MHHLNRPRRCSKDREGIPAAGRNPAYVHFEVDQLRVGFIQQDIETGGGADGTELEVVIVVAQPQPDLLQAPPPSRSGRTRRPSSHPRWAGGRASRASAAPHRKAQAPAWPREFLRRLIESRLTVLGAGRQMDAGVLEACVVGRLAHDLRRVAVQAGKFHGLVPGSSDLANVPLRSLRASGTDGIELQPEGQVMAA